ncbi:MAG: universal stress protein, partial [Verrucomicrobia bacterium]|nr:universal stress protein [Verrucomicrobiota bacterium]
MGWADILVHVDGSAAGRERADYALRLAELMGAKLHGLHVEQTLDVRPLFKLRMINAVEKYQEHVAKLDAAQSGQAFHDIARPSDGWTATKGDMVDAISQYAAYCDLVIVGQYETAGTPEKRPLTLAASLVLKCGRPVLLLPASHK